MDTKHKIIDEALTLFSEKGYANVYVGDIAARVGIKAPSLYKHFKNKRAIFDAIIEEMNARFLQQASMLHVNGTDARVDAAIYKEISEDQMILLARNFFHYYLHDEYTKKFRKMLTIEQFSNKELADTYSKLYVDDPLSYQGALLGMLAAEGFLHAESTEVMTLHFYSPIYLLLTLCDRDSSREEEAIKLLDAHVRQFNSLYGRKNNEDNGDQRY